jgi:antitoxin component of RelBE/YafQ-DinJ toxin-antitoxin module
MSDVGNVHSNEVEGELEGVMRTLVAAAGRLGENMARMREDRARRAEAESVQRARETSAQFEQERAMARAQVQPTREPAWWDRASAEDVAQAYETTSAWKDHDPDLAQAHARMGDELRERYGIDVDNIGADPQRVADVLNERAATANGVPVEGSTEQERREADQLLNAADQHDRNAEAARGDATAAQDGAEGERAPGVGPNGEIGAGYQFEDMDEPVRHDPNAERTITLTLNEYEADRIDKFLAATAFVSRQAPDEHDIDPEDGRTWDQLVTDTRASHDNAVGMRDRLSEARTAAAQGTADREQGAGDQDRSAGLSAWDNADRRDGHAEQMAGAGVEPVAVQAQYGADVSNAKHPRAAVTSTRGAAKARKTATKAMGATRERGDRSR